MKSETITGETLVERSTRTEKYEICIVGGGLIGLTATLAMAQKGFSVALIEGGSLACGDNLNKGVNRVYALNALSQALLERLGVWQCVQLSALSPYRNMEIWDVGGEGRIDFDSRMILQKELGYIVEENGLKSALINALANYPNVHLFPNKKVTHIVSEQKTITLRSDDSIWTASVLMVADGAQSSCRELLKVPITQWSYHQTAIVASVEVEQQHQQTAYQIFHPNEVLAFLPLSQSNHCSIVWSTSPARAKQLMDCSKDTFNANLKQTFQSRLGNVQVIGKRVCFPLRMRHVQQYSDASWLLLGDAAHTLHPFVGWGLNLGFSDLQAWLECLDRVGGNLRSKERALAAYQRQRKYEVWQVIGLLEGLKTLFFNRLPSVPRLRGWGLNTCNRFLPLKQALIAYATKI